MSLTDELVLLEEGAAIVDRPECDHVLVSGPDTWSFLQALVSADLDTIADGLAAPSLLLSPQGKLDVAFRILHVGDDAWLDTDAGLGAQLVVSLNRFKIRVQADVVDRSDVFTMASLIGPDVAARLGGRLPGLVHGHAEFADVQIVRTAVGADLIGPTRAVADVVNVLVAEGWARSSAAAHEAFRIARGVPQQPADIDERTIPQEAELEVDAVSFTKGCFLGQELVCRIDSRGHVNRFLRRITGIDGDRPVVGAEIVADDVVLGTLTSVTPVGSPAAALGYVRREVEPPSAVVLRWPGGTATASIASLRP